jgi:programmed cell death 6-interacting protein
MHFSSQATTTLQSLLNTLQNNYTRSERDNNLIYHHEIPAASTLAPIQETSMVRSVVPPGLENPKAALGEESLMFDEMLGWGAREAISKPSCQ